MARTYELTYRFKTDPENRPSQTDTVPEHMLEEMKAEIKAHGGVICAARILSWREQLATMENNPERL